MNRDLTDDELRIILIAARMMLGDEIALDAINTVTGDSIATLDEVREKINVQYPVFRELAHQAAREYQQSAETRSDL
jgi:hypothetical protein